MGWVLVGLVVGGGAGASWPRRVEMTKMPELVAFMHSMIGLAAVFIAVAAVAEPWAFGSSPRGQPIPAGNRLELAWARPSARSPSAARSSPSASCRASTSSACSRARRCSSRASTCSTWCWACDGSADRFMATSNWMAFLADAGAGLRAGRADHHPDRRRRHAGGGVDAQQLLGLGGGGHRLLAEQQHADHRRLAGGLVGRDPLATSCARR
jgi:hypothetical protein